MQYSTLTLLALGASLLPTTLAQSSCGLSCISNVSGTTCTQGQWSCLCLNANWLSRTASCAQLGCSAQEYADTISGIAEICAINNDAVTLTPYATASTASSNNPVLTALSVTPSSSAPSATTTVSSGTGSASSTSASAMSSMSTVTSSAASSASATAAMTSANMAHRADASSATSYGIVMAILGLAAYL